MPYAARFSGLEPVLLSIYHGWDKKKKKKRIDYIFIDKKVKVLKSTVIFNGINKPVISDHFGVEVDILIEE